VWTAVSSMLKSSRDRRCAEHLIEELSQYRVALLVGAGADLALSNGLRWSDLVGSLFPPQEVPSSALLSSWVIELAAAARHYLGDEEYVKRVMAGTGTTPRPSPMWQALAELSHRVPLVVTTNYSHWLLKALERGRTPSIVDRTTLRGARLPEPGVPFTRPTLVYIHGRQNELVLDRFGYNDAEHFDLLYRDFLTQLFERWTVLAIGFSFSDAAVRTAASLAQARRPELRKSHVWIDQSNLDRRFKWYARASFFSYSIARLEVPDHDHTAVLTEALAKAQLPDPLESINAIKTKNYSQLADNLDLSGDFESDLQRRVFRDTSVAQQVCTDILASPPPPLVLARIERHLRHHLYFVKPANQAGNLRLRLWTRVADMVESDPFTAKAVCDDPQLHLDLLIGALEVNQPVHFVRLRKKLGDPSEPLLRERLARSEQVWHNSPHPQGTATYSELRRWAASVGWESIESKLALDEARAQATEILANHTSKLTAKHIDRVVQACTVSLRAAQYAGTPRRALGSLILRSLWIPSDVEAKIILRGAVVLAQDSATLDTTLVAAVAWAWQRLFSSRNEAFAEVAWTSPPPDTEIAQQELYWSGVAAPLRS
jgi:hypothetical protein